MSGEIVNLRRARKAKAKDGKAAAAAQNRIAFGESKAARALRHAVAEMEEKRHESHRLAPPPGDARRD